MKTIFTILFSFLFIAFCHAQVPSITSFSPASGAVGTLVTITGTNLGSPTAFSIGGANAIVVSNTGTTLVGMVMPGAATGSVSVTTANGTGTGSGNFIVTATPWPSVQQGSKLVGTGAVGSAGQGRIVALSADGNTAIVGGPQDNTSAGAAWVYTRSGTTWTQQGSKLVGTGTVGAAGQGQSVSISADGNTVAIGGLTDNSNAGATWIFTRNGGVWTQQGSKLVGTGATGAAQQGQSVYLSADGNTLLVGGLSDNSSKGAVWIFTRSAGVWTQQGSKLVGTGGVGASQQGQQVALSADGLTAIVGAHDDNGSLGATWIFAKNGGVWAQQGSKLIGSGSLGATNQGRGVSISADGNTIMIGGPNNNGGAGAAWIYTRSGTTWTQQGSILVGTGAVGSASQGTGVHLSADGNTAIIGGITDNGNTGAAWVFTRSGSVWSQQGSKLVGTGATGAAEQGMSVSVSADGSTSMIGGIKDNTNAGAAWVFVVAPPVNNCLAGTATATGATSPNYNTVICNNTSTPIILTGASVGTIQWQQSADGTSWANVSGGSGATSATYTTPNLTTTTYYRALVTNSCYEISSNTVIVSVLPATPALAVTLTNQTPTSIVAAWTPNAVNSNDVYNVTWTGGGSANGVNSPYVIASGVTAGSTYTVTVSEVTPAGCPATGTATINTLCVSPTLTLSAATVNGFTASWTNTGATTYRLYYKSAATSAYSFVDVTGTSYIFENVAGHVSLYGASTYLCYVAAENCPVNGQFGVQSSEKYIATSGNSGNCGIPTINAVSNCANQITVTLGGGSGTYRLILGRIAPNPSASVAYSITGTSVNINVGTQNASSTWQLYASGNCGSGSYTAISNPVYVVIKPGCNQLQNLILSTPSCFGFEATWNADNCSGNLVSYELYWKKQAALGYYGYNVGTNNYFDLGSIPAGTYNAYVASVSCNGAVGPFSTVQTITTGVGCRTDEDVSDNTSLPTENTGAKAGMTIYPNPTNGNFMVNIYTKNGANENIKIEMVNTLGQVVYTLITPVTNGISNNAFQMPENVAAGIYFIHTIVNGTNLSQRVMYTK